MTDPNYMLYVASYGDDDAAASEDFKAIKELGDTAGVGLVGGGAVVGGGVGLVVGLFAPPLLLADRGWRGYRRRC